jgi:hypothetical protein
LLGLCAAPFASVVVSFTVALCMCAFDTFYVETDISCLCMVVTVRRHHASPQNFINHFCILYELSLICSIIPRNSVT